MDTLDQIETTPTATAECPVGVSHQKTAREVEQAGPALERTAPGVWQVRGFDEARIVLRHPAVTQAGFKAELVQKVPSITNQPILFQDGKPHHQQRAKTARFFTPKTVSTSYRQLMENLSDQLVTEVETKPETNLSNLSLRMAVRVAAEVVGLTNSRLPGMAGRLDVFFNSEMPELTWNPIKIFQFLKLQYHTLAFLFVDVKPAIQARRRQPREDVISHLLTQNYKDTEILIECVTFAAAGMVTTREFISVAVWHFLEQPALRQRYLIASEVERHAILEEILRLEPVVGHLYRRAQENFVIHSGGQQFEIAKGDLLDINIHSTNLDESVVGEQAAAICPGRALKGKQIPESIMSFGDGAHRCPGEYIAIQETDILLQRLLKLEKLRFVRKPSVGWNELVTGYELRNFMITAN